jgi:hypothetical protein
MIPYEELDRALARWKARTHGGAAAAEPATAVGVIEAEAPVTDLEAEAGDYSGAIAPPAPNGRTRRLDQSGEISLEEEVIETYDDDQ